MEKIAGESPLRIILVSFTVIFFVALFIWQIDRYLKASQDSKLQGQISRINLMIETDSLETQERHRFAYLHDPVNIAQPLEVGVRGGRKPKFKPQSTLASLFIKNHFTASGAGKNSCYIYVYFPPEQAKTVFDFYDSGSPAYVVAGWSEHQNKPVVMGTPTINTWFEANLKAGHFYCEPETLMPDTLARLENGQTLALPGYNFQFSNLYYSKVKQ